MPIRHSFLSAAALFALATFAGACGDHRTEDFCTNICACIGDGTPEDNAACTTSCTDQVSVAEEQSSEQVISDECFSCVSTNSCQRLETACSDACQSVTDALNQPEPEPEPDPQPGVL